MSISKTFVVLLSSLLALLSGAKAENWSNCQAVDQAHLVMQFKITSVTGTKYKATVSSSEYLGSAAYTTVKFDGSACDPLSVGEKYMVALQSSDYVDYRQKNTDNLSAIACGAASEWQAAKAAAEDCPGRYLGCVSSSDFGNKPSWTQKTWMTNTRCVSHCNDHAFAATRNGYECWCYGGDQSNDSISTTSENESKCNIDCPKDKNDHCGGSNAFSLYHV